jgi:hypothetical protein
MQTKLIGASARKQLRRRYRETWGRDWPENDKYLTVLWNETKRPGASWSDRYEETLVAMRESHEFTA